MAHKKKAHGSMKKMEKEMSSHIKHEKAGMKEDMKMKKEMKKGCK